MADSGEDPDQGTGGSTRVIAIAAVLAALLALVVALGLVLRANQSDENDPSTVNPMGSDSNGLPVGDEVSGQEVAFAPPWPARRVGGNCSAGGIVAHWRVEAGGEWQCTMTTPDAAVPAAPAPPPPPPVEPPPPELSTCPGAAARVRAAAGRRAAGLRAPARTRADPGAGTRAPAAAPTAAGHPAAVPAAADLHSARRGRPAVTGATPTSRSPGAKRREPGMPPDVVDRVTRRLDLGPTR
ncbi:hypothetical protein [Nocardia sp. MW-W600-9]